jgi:transcription elongation factor GreA
LEVESVAANNLVDRLKEELSTLEREFRVEIPQRILRAREMGDLSESGEYETAKDRQGFLHARIGFLKQRIAELSSIELSQVPRDRVAFGSTVHLVDEETGEEKIYRLVAPEEVNTEQGCISTASPVARSLMGRKEGDSLVVRTPSGEHRYELVRLITLHDELKGRMEEANG